MRKKEIERKFLTSISAIDSAGLTSTGDMHICQGYLCVGDGGSEARVRSFDGKYQLTVKCGIGIERDEIEIPLTLQQFTTLFEGTRNRRIFKSRHTIRLACSRKAEIDFFDDRLKGLVVIEVEFPTLNEAQDFIIPKWFGREVTDDLRYRNRYLADTNNPIPPKE